MGNIDCLDPSGSNHRPADDDDDFSLSSCHNFGSNYLEVLSEEEGDLLCESDDESYIEIQLRNSKPSSVNGDAQDPFPYPDLDDDDDEEEHIELRISISSRAVPFPQRFISASIDSEAETSATSSSFVTAASLNSSTMSSFSMPGFVKNGYPFQGEELMMASAETLSELGCRGDDIKGRRTRTRTRNRGRSLQFPAINRLLTALLSSLKVSPEMCQETPASSNPSISNLEPLRTRTNFSRKASSRSSTTTNGSIMMKFLIKFRATQIGTFLTSLMKSRQGVPPPGRNSKGSEKKKKKEKNKHEVNLEFHARTPEGKEINEKGRKPKLSVLEIHLNNGMKGVIEAVRIGRKSESSNCKTKKKMKSSNSSNEKKSRSCPTSTKSSPLHRDGKIHLGESSIQAAIAHCKNSFAFFPDFRFDPVITHP